MIIFNLLTVFLIISFSSYFNARSIDNWLIFTVTTNILFIFQLLILYFEKKGKIDNYTITFISFLLLFFWGYYSDKFLLYKVSPVSWMSILGISFVVEVIKKYKIYGIISYKKLAALILIIIISTTVLFNIFDESFLGTPRSVRTVKNYLFKKKLYHKENIEDIWLNKTSKNADDVYVIFTDEPDIIYEYKVKGKRVNQGSIKGDISKDRLLNHKEST